ncbi:MAG: biopolymer transporter ExbD [Zetaproteobacteria bacterium]|nr:biopolymer transporter ExbD [Zetaproteobacteria bacterium]
MAGGSRFDQDEAISDINVTPLVDVMMVLLIIFMVTASYISHKTITVKLPKAATATDVSSKNLSFALDASSNLYLDGTPIDFAAIETSILERQQNYPDTPTDQWQALISADITTPHGAVVKLIDKVRKSGVLDFAIQVEALNEQDNE